MIIAIDEKIIAGETMRLFQIEYDICLKLLNGYIQYLKTKKNEGL